MALMPSKLAEIFDDSLHLERAFAFGFYCEINKYFLRQFYRFKIVQFITDGEARWSGRIYRSKRGELSRSRER